MNGVARNVLGRPSQGDSLDIEQDSSSPLELLCRELTLSKPPPMPNSSSSSSSSTKSSLNTLPLEVILLATDPARLRSLYRFLHTGPMPRPDDVIDDAEDLRAMTRSSIALSSARASRASMLSWSNSSESEGASSIKRRRRPHSSSSSAAADDFSEGVGDEFPDFRARSYSSS